MRIKSDLIRQLREGLRLTQKEVADAARMDVRTYGRYERGEINEINLVTQYETLDRLARALRLDSAEQLIDRAFPVQQAPVQEDARFIVGANIPKPCQFFGRERELSRIHDLLSTFPLQHAAIIGPRRSGKTSLLHHLQQLRAAAPEDLRPDQCTAWRLAWPNHRWIYIDFQDERMGEKHLLLRHILSSISLSLSEEQVAAASAHLHTFLAAVEKTLSHPTVILLDEIGVALKRYRKSLDDGLWDSMRALAGRVGGQLAYILSAPRDPMEISHTCSLSSPFFNIFGYVIDLGPFTEEEALHFVRSRCPGMPDQDIEWILKESGAWPILLQILCRERYQCAGESWRDEGLAQISRYRYLLSRGRRQT